MKHNEGLPLSLCTIHSAGAGCCQTMPGSTDNGRSLAGGWTKIDHGFDIPMVSTFVWEVCPE